MKFGMLVDTGTAPGIPAQTEKFQISWYVEILHLIPEFLLFALADEVSEQISHWLHHKQYFKLLNGKQKSINR